MRAKAIMVKATAVKATTVKNMMSTIDRANMLGAGML
jgi:hypothetical protein